MQTRKMDMKECWKMLQRILILEEGRVPAKNARGGQLEGQNRSHQEERRRLREKFEVGGFMAQEGCRGAVPKEEGDLLREYRLCTNKTFSANC